jgi:hypothetical protein
MNKKKLVSTSLIMAIALSTIGYVYAAWTDTIYIKGQVEMGSLTLAFDYREPAHCVEYYEDPDTGILVEGEWLGKDVGSCNVTMSELVWDEHTNKSGWKVATLIIMNAYPQYIVHTTFIVRNIGTIPINLCKFTLQNAGKYDNVGNLVYGLLYDGLLPGKIYEDRNGDGVINAGDVCVINIDITNSFPIQVDPCNPNKMEIDMDFKQEAQECHTYKFEVVVWGIQWNKPCDELPP